MRKVTFDYLINRSFEILDNEGFSGLLRAIKRFFLFHPIGDEIVYRSYGKVKKEVIKNVLDFRMYLDLWIRLSASSEFKRVPGFLTYYRVHPESISSDWHKMNIIRAKVEWKNRLFMQWVKSVFFIIPKDYLINKSPTLKRIYKFGKKIVVK